MIKLIKALAKLVALLRNHKVQQLNDKRSRESIKRHNNLAQVTKQIGTIRNVEAEDIRRIQKDADDTVDAVKSAGVAYRDKSRKREVALNAAKLELETLSI